MISVNCFKANIRTPETSFQVCIHVLVSGATGPAQHMWGSAGRGGLGTGWILAFIMRRNPYPQRMNLISIIAKDIRG